MGDSSRHSDDEVCRQCNCIETALARDRESPSGSTESSDESDNGAQLESCAPPDAAICARHTRACNWRGL